MKASITGGEHKDKEMIVAVAQEDGQLSIQFSHYKLLEFLPPEQVSPSTLIQGMTMGCSL
jgi:hypothetical protein